VAKKSSVDQVARAHEAWGILVEAAQRKQSMTYGQLASRMGIHHRACAPFLGLIQEQCRGRELPPLQSLVVNKQTSVPGGGYHGSGTDMRELIGAQDEVFAYAWGEVANPF
jgi:putative restriction endonuclease